MTAYLSKSDFKVARDCPAKLYYKKRRYPSTKDQNTYLKMLAEGGFMVEKIAKLLQSDPVEMEFDLAGHEKAFAETQDRLKVDKVTLCEATLLSQGKLARVDILRKRGNVFELVEVKAKSYDSRENDEAVARGSRSLFWKKRGGISSDWQEYLEDVAFQVLVLKELYPECKVRPFLCMPDKARTTGIEGLASQFELRRVAREGSLFERYEVRFTGDVEQLRKDNLLVEVPVEAEVEYLSESVQRAAATFVASLMPSLKKIPVELSTDCSRCEYRSDGADQRDGFRDCWGKLADAQPHILSLYRVGQVGGNGVKADDLIHAGKVNLFDVTPESLCRKDGTLGTFGERQLTQIEYTRSNREWISDELRPILARCEYPLYFIDFETTTLAIPYHAGMHPYEPVAFQWSCHTIAAPGASVVHAEWINTEDAFPNFEFARSLMRQIGSSGTVFKYAAHETTILKSIRRQMDDRGHHDAGLERWLDEMGSNDRLVDMYQGLTLKHYYHPLMKGSNSIKQVVDAMWKSNPGLRDRFPEYIYKSGGQLLSPYKALPSLVIQGEPVVVTEGTGAMRAYEAMMYGLEKDDPVIREQWRKLLLQYCQLDTAAMVMLWMHWTGQF